MSCNNRFPHALAYAALAILLLPSLHAQTATNKKDVMSTAPAPTSGNGNRSQEKAEVRTEKFKYKQQVTGTQAAPADDNDQQKHHNPPTTTAPSVDHIQKKHVANVTAAPGGNSASSTTGTSTSTSTATPQPTQDKTKFKQEFGPTQVNKKN